jgi:HD-GYP domain-containing protein (c-di-GMP phosphodiesterase class II)
MADRVVAHPKAVAEARPASDPGRSFCHILARFTRGLQRCQSGAEQRRLFLQTMAEGVRSSIAFAWERDRPDGAEMAGERTARSGWCASLAQRLVSTHTDGEACVWVPARVSNSLEAGPPYHVALIRISRTPGQWVGVLRFDLSRPFADDEIEFMSLARQLLGDHHRHGKLFGELKETVLGLVRSFTTAIDAKDRYTSGHSERVGRMATRLGVEMGVPGSVLSDLYLAGLLHDIGKIGVRDSVLLKDGELTDEERDHIREHPIIGERIVSSIRQLAHLCSGVRNHHERFDGRGYPDRLAGEAIPLLARVLAVADACDAMMADRPYRRSVPVGRIETVILEGAGKQWDPVVVGHFMACRQDLYAICQKGLGQSVCAAVEETIGARHHQASEEFSI